jgi:hypothetical protein
MSETTDIVERLRAYPSQEKLEAADEIDSLRFEITILTDERDAALAEISVLTQDRDAARADASCAHDRINMLQNEIRQ